MWNVEAEERQKWDEMIMTSHNTLLFLIINQGKTIWGWNDWVVLRLDSLLKNETKQPTNKKQFFYFSLLIPKGEIKFPFVVKNKSISVSVFLLYQ